MANNKISIEMQQPEIVMIPIPSIASKSIPIADSSAIPNKCHSDESQLSSCKSKQPIFRPKRRSASFYHLFQAQ